MATLSRGHVGVNPILARDRLAGWGWHFAIRQPETCLADSGLEQTIPARLAPKRVPGRDTRMPEPEAGEADPGASAVKPKEGEADPGAGAVRLKEGEADPAASAVRPKEGEADPGAGAVRLKEGEADPAASAVKPKDRKSVV